ncbi:MAG: hypothetical protein JO258_09305, partial [Alphaproteobacteria bacterium]|nr:hypothetical protein [Alphaproteobacteria bacterium]
GPAWFPKGVRADWAPYRYGHWRWVAPWGWTWIDDAAWGFAPSHYGRWAHLAGAEGERWGWIPGSLVQHPVYMPAAVAFLGTAGVGISYADAFAPAVAWFPLAPGEIYWPGYTKDADTIRRTNTGSVTDLDAIIPDEDGGPPESVINGGYRNRSLATAVPRTVFLTAKQVALALVLLPELRLKNAPLLAGSPQINPVPSAPATVATSMGRGMVAMQNLAHLVTPQPQPAMTAASAAHVVVLGRAAAARIPVVIAVAKQRALAPRQPAARLAAANITRAGRPATMRFAAAAGRRGGR